MKGCISGFSLALLFLATYKPISNSGYSLQTSKNRNNLLQSHYNVNSDTGFVGFFFSPYLDYNYVFFAEFIHSSFNEASSPNGVTKCLKFSRPSVNRQPVQTTTDTLGRPTSNL